MNFGFIFALCFCPLSSGENRFFCPALAPGWPRNTGDTTFLRFFGAIRRVGSVFAARNWGQTQGAGGFHIFCCFIFSFVGSLCLLFPHFFVSFVAGPDRWKNNLQKQEQRKERSNIRKKKNQKKKNKKYFSSCCCPLLFFVFGFAVHKQNNKTTRKQPEEQHQQQHHHHHPPPPKKKKNKTTK